MDATNATIQLEHMIGFPVENIGSLAVFIAIVNQVFVTILGKFSLQRKLIDPILLLIGGCCGIIYLFALQPIFFPAITTSWFTMFILGILNSAFINFTVSIKNKFTGEKDG